MSGYDISTKNAVNIVDKEEFLLARDTFQFVLNEFKNSKKIKEQRIVAIAWFGYVYVLQKMEEKKKSKAKYNRVIEEYTLLVDYFENTKDSAILEYILKSLSNKSILLFKEKEYEEAISTLDKVIKFKNDSRSKILILVALAWFNKGSIAKNNLQKITIFSSLIEHFIKTDNFKIKNILSSSCENIAWAQLLEKEYEYSIYYSDLGLHFTPSRYKLNFNKSYALILLDKVEEGNQLYYKTLKRKRNNLQKCKLKEDFILLKENGIKHIVLKKIDEDLEKFCR